MRRFLTLTILVIGSVLVLGCGDGNGGGDGATSIDESGDDRPAGGGNLTAADMCKLLTRAEIESAVGNKVEEGAPDFGLTCDWDSDPLDTSVLVALIPLANRQLCETALSTDAVYKKDSSYSEPAFTSYSSGFGGSADVVVCSARGQLQLVVSGGLDDTNNEAKLRGAASDLMKKVLSRL